MGNKQIFTAILLFLMAFLLGSCSNKTSAVIQDTTCKAPCWRGIEVGKTGIEETLQLLKQMPDIETSTIGRGRNPEDSIEVVGVNFINNQETSLEITFENGKVAALYFSFVGSIFLKDAISTFGEPKYIYLSAIKGDPVVYLTGEFFYPDMGICLFHQNHGLILHIPKTYKISGFTAIDEIYYVDTSIPHGQIKYGCFTGGNES